MGYDFDIVYKKGASNRVADALSRKYEGEEDETADPGVLTRPIWQDWETIEEEIQKDEELRKIIEELKVDPEAHGNYTLENERLHYKGRLVLSTTSH